MLSFHGKKLEPKHVKEVVKIHELAFQNFFLTVLGTRFLNHFYTALVKRKDVLAIGYWDRDGHLTGFFVANYGHDGFYRSLSRENFFRFFFSTFRTFLLRPMLLRRLARSFSANNSGPRFENYAYLMSICVDPTLQNKGLGTLMLNDLINLIRKSGYKGVYLTTDAIGNSAVNSFYIRAGFVKRGTIWQGKREMNIYSKDLAKT